MATTSETDKRLFEEISATYDEMGKILVEMVKEIDQQIIPRFGTDSAITRKKIEQVQKFRGFFDSTLNYINFLRNLNHQMYQQFLAMDLDRLRKSLGLPTSKIMELAGDTRDEWKHVDKLDDLIARARKEIDLTDQDTPAEQLEQFLQILKRPQ